MDIKNKFPPSPPKGTSVADSKKSQDVYPKASRRKEAIGANNFLRNEQPRKYNIQRTKNIVKRSRAKGQYHGCTEEDTKVVETKWAEHGSVLVHGSKKENHLLNGNHLLNFHYELTDAQRRSGGKSTRRYSRNSNRWLPPVEQHKYNKEQFLQASCQFVVPASRDYSLHLINPDVLVNWNLIEQIKIHSSEVLSCPICLCPPVAGKMTRCGHVYCWPCILHYIHVSDENNAWCKCPICYDFVNKDDLRSVVEITQNTFNTGDMLNLCLMRRERGSVFAMPVEPAMQPPATFLSVSEKSDNQIYSKLLIASIEDIMDIVHVERSQLKDEFEINADCYIQQALNELSKRENKLLSKIAESRDVLPTVNAEEGNSKQTLQEDEVNADTCCKDDTMSLTERSSKSVDSASSDSQTASSPSKFTYFYQAEDGQHLYLHAVNVKMLEMQYGSLEKSPLVITGKLLEKEAGSYTEDLRRRLRYLCHLPLTCQFELAEIELKPPLVSKEVLRAFRDQLNLRQKRRERREREERKREKKITEEQNKRMGKYPTLNVNIESRRHFPEWIPELLFAEECAPSPSELTAISSIASSPSSNMADEIVSSLETDHLHEQQQGPSFAEMLRNTGTRIKTTRPSISSSIQSRTCSGTVRMPLNENKEDVEEAYYASPPSNNQCLGDALARALEQNKLQESGATNDRNNATGKRKKKKKGKATVLFATNMARGS